jgi:hypothetical protein
MPGRVSSHHWHLKPPCRIAYQFILKKIEESSETGNRQTVFTCGWFPVAPFPQRLHTDTNQPGDVTPPKSAFRRQLLEKPWHVTASPISGAHFK